MTCTSKQIFDVVSSRPLNVVLIAVVVIPSKGPFRPRASTRVDAAYFQVMYAYSSSCQLRHFQLRHCIVNDVISTGVVWRSLTQTFWPFIDINAKNFISFTNVKAHNE